MIGVGTVCPSKVRHTESGDVYFPPAPFGLPHEPVCTSSGGPPFVAQWVVVPMGSAGFFTINVRAQIHVCRNCGSLYMDAENRAKIGCA